MQLSESNIIITILSLTTLGKVFGRSISQYQTHYGYCWKETGQCATNEADFRNRATMFNCSKGAYTCMLTSENILVETCAPIYNISAHASGCPTIVCGSEGVGLSSSSFAYCPSNIDGCPNGKYGTYRTSTLFLYPKCLLRLQDRFCVYNKEAEEPNDKLDVSNADPTSQRYGHIILLISILGVISILLLIGIIISIQCNAWKLRTLVSSFKHTPKQKGRENTPETSIVFPREYDKTDREMLMEKSNG